MALWTLCSYKFTIISNYFIPPERLSDSSLCDVKKLWSYFKVVSHLSRLFSFWFMACWDLFSEQDHLKVLFSASIPLTKGPWFSCLLITRICSPATKSVSPSRIRTPFPWIQWKPFTFPDKFGGFFAFDACCVNSLFSAIHPVKVNSVVSSFRASTLHKAVTDAAGVLCRVIA